MTDLELEMLRIDCIRDVPVDPRIVEQLIGEVLDLLGVEEENESLRSQVEEFQGEVDSAERVRSTQIRG